MVLIPVPAVWLQYWPRCWCTTFSGLVHCGSPHRPFGLVAHSGFLQVPCCLLCGGGLHGSCFAVVGFMAVVSYTFAAVDFLGVAFVAAVVLLFILILIQYCFQGFALVLPCCSRKRHHWVQVDSNRTMVPSGEAVAGPSSKEFGYPLLGIPKSRLV